MAKPASVHDAYVAHGARGYYQQFGAHYRNPHEPIVAGLIEKAVAEWPLDRTSVLDLAAGSGEVSLALASAVARASRPCSEHGRDARATNITAIDPFTSKAYEARTGNPCESMTFEQIAAGGLRGRKYSLVVCSFAMHLVDLSRLPTLCWELAGVADQLLILTPHKRPAIQSVWNWTLTHERMQERVRARLYVVERAVQPAAKGLS